MSHTVSSRRRFLTQLGGAFLGATYGLQERDPAWAGHPPYTEGFEPDVEVWLTATASRARMLLGDPTNVWTFQGRVVRGDAHTLEDVPSGALSPTFRVRVGQRVRVVLSNDLPQETIIHWHGLHVPWMADGHPSLAIRPGGLLTYEFAVRGPAATYWYHAHPDGRTGEQVYRGLAGLFIVEDPDESIPLLPAGPYDVPLVLQDRRFDLRNRLVYLTSPLDRMTGFLGDQIVVNGQADFQLSVARRSYRFRILNASNSRIYRLAWADGSPLTVIGTDGGLLETPVRKPYAMLGPGERLEAWVDFSQRPLGSETRLVSQPFDAPRSMSMGGVPQGAPLDLVKIAVQRPSADRIPLPEKLRTIPRYRWADAINAARPRTIVPTMHHMGFGLNGRSFEMNAVASDEHMDLGTLEAWEFDNTANATGMGMGMGMGMMGMGPMPHPFHVHGGQFQVVRREGVTHAGYVDAGWKDTILVMPGETATFLMRAPDYVGTYLYHCHNLEHEDAGMMRNFRVDP